MSPLTSSSVSRLRTFTDGAETLLLWLFSILLVADVLLGILARYVDFEIVFADELGKYLFIWLCMIGISAATKDNQHVRLTFLSSAIPLSRIAIRLISQILFLLFSLILLYWSARLTWMHFTMDKSVMGFRFPIYVFTTALPFGFALNSLRLIQDIAGIIRRPHRNGRSGGNDYAMKQP